jgi:hypothetical protein
MDDASILHEIAKTVRALQIRAVEAQLTEAEALLAKTAGAVYNMALEAEEDERAQARSVEEMMRRLRVRES